MIATFENLSEKTIVFCHIENIVSGVRSKRDKFFILNVKLGDKVTEVQTDKDSFEHVLCLLHQSV